MSTFNPFYGYEEKLFNNTEIDDDDKEADKQYKFFDDYMDQRRKNIKEKNELINLKRNRNEQPTIRQAFSSLKNELKTLTQADWESIPDIKDFTLKKRKIERYTPITDTEILSALNDTITPIQEKKEEGLENVGKAKNSILKLLIDKIGTGENLENNSVDKMSYLNELNALNKDNLINPLNSFGYIQDIKKAKLLLNNLILTNPYNPLSWISAARLEEFDNQNNKAREILSKAVDKIKDSEDLWLEYTRVNSNDNAKSKEILRQGIKNLPKSEKLYLELINKENNINEKKKIIKKCIFEDFQTSEKLWNKLIELEKNNEEVYKKLLLKSVEYLPKAINNWILLSKQCEYEEAKNILLKAMKINNDSLQLKFEYLFFEEENKKENDLQKIFNNLFDNINEVNNDEFIKYACEAEKRKCIISCEIIISSSVNNIRKKNNYKETKNIFKKIIEDLKSKNYIFIYTIKQIYINLLKINDNKDIELWIKYIDFIKTNISIEEIEKIFREALNKVTKDVYKETFYLLYAKILRDNDKIENAIKILKEGYSKLNKDNILFALIKLNDMKKLYKENINLLKNAIQKNSLNKNKDILIFLIKEYTNLNDINEALNECSFGIKNFPLIDEFYLLNTDLLLMKDNKDENKLKEAVTILRNGIKMIPDSYKLYIKLSNVLFELKFYNQARAVIDKGLGNKKLCDCIELYKEQILLEMKMDNKIIAKNLLDKALQKFNGNEKIDTLKELETKLL